MSLVTGRGEDSPAAFCGATSLHDSTNAGHQVVVVTSWVSGPLGGSVTHVHGFSMFTCKQTVHAQ